MPVINLASCTRCLKCAKDCPSDAISIETGVIAETCIHCGHCVAVCPETAVSPDQGDVVPLRANLVTPENFRNLSAAIRTCRSFLSKDIPEEILLQLVDNMKHYPSASNSRPLQVTIVRSAEKMKLLNSMTEASLVRMFSFITSPFISPLIRVFVPSISISKLQRYKNSFLEKRKSNNSLICHHAPVALLLHGAVTKTGMPEADANIWATYTSLYANTMGLGTCFNGFIVKAMGKNSKQNQFFGIPAKHQVYAALLLGYPKVKYVNECSRKSPEASLI
jgi:ferredoxin